MDARIMAITNAVEDINRNLMLLQDSSTTPDKFNALLEDTTKALGRFDQNYLHKIRQMLGDT